MSIKASITYQECANDTKDEVARRLDHARSLVRNSQFAEALQEIHFVVDTLIPHIQDYEDYALAAFRQEEQERSERRIAPSRP